MVKNPPAKAGDAGNVGSVPGSERSPGGGNGNHSGILSGRIPWTEKPGGLHPWSHKELDATEHTHTHHDPCLLSQKINNTKKTKNIISLASLYLEIVLDGSSSDRQMETIAPHCAKSLDRLDTSTGFFPEGRLLNCLHRGPKHRAWSGDLTE